MQKEVPTIRTFRMLEIETINALEVASAILEELAFRVNDDRRPAALRERTQVVHQQHRLTGTRRTEEDKRAERGFRVQRKIEGTTKRTRQFPQRQLALLRLFVQRTREACALKVQRRCPLRRAVSQKLVELIVRQ